jgi:hypothetical protein
MKVALLYKIFGIGIAVVMLVMFTLWRVEQSSLPKELPAEVTPTHSGFTEVEFESGEPVKNLTALQTKRLHSYRGDPKTDATLEVPIERAIAFYLETEKRGKAK